MNECVTDSHTHTKGAKSESLTVIMCFWRVGGNQRLREMMESEPPERSQTQNKNYALLNILAATGAVDGDNIQRGADDRFPAVVSDQSCERPGCQTM